MNHGENGENSMGKWGKLYSGIKDNSMCKYRYYFACFFYFCIV